MKKILQLILILFFNFSSSQETVYEILNLSINSKFAELGVIYSKNNSVIFASSKKDNAGKRSNNRQLSLELYKGLIAENGDIVQTEKFSDDINNRFFESDISFTPDFKTVFFTWNNFYNTQTRKDSAKWKTLRIFKASINEKFEILKVTPLPFNNKAYSVRSPVVSKDGKKLFFISDMPGGFGETDIYVADIVNDQEYGIPKNLGSAINTKQAELFPYIDQNNTLYFSSNGHKGHGGLDIFKSEFINGNFQQAINLPTPFNSDYDDFAYVINNVSNSGYFTSNRDGGKGDVDIYSFKPKEPECAQTMIVLAFNALTEKQLDQVVVTLFQNDILVEKQTVGQGTNYKFKIDCDKTYKLVAKKENFKNTELAVNTNEKNNLEIVGTLKLTPIECVQYLSGTVTNSETNLALDQAVVSLFQNDILVEKQTVGKSSNYKFKIDCDKTYKLVAEKENFKNTELAVNTNEKNNLEIVSTLKLTPIECVQYLSGTVTNSETNLGLDQAVITLFQNDILLEKQTVSKGTNYKFKIDCDKAYKLVAEKENFKNTELAVNTNEKNNLEIVSTLKLTPIECVQYLSGTVTNSETNLGLDQAVVSLFQNDILVEKQTVGQGSNYKFKIDCDKTYKLVAEKENFKITELAINTNEKNNFDNVSTLKLTPIECVQYLSGTVTNSETNLGLDQAVVSLFQNDILVEKQTVVKGTNFKFKIDCDKTYKLVAEKENFKIAKLAINTNEKNNLEIVNALKLTPIKCVQYLSGTVTNSETNLGLDQAVVSLFQNDILVEKQTVSKGTNYKFKIDCDKAYKLVAEKENFKNTELAVNTNEKNNLEIVSTLKLTPIECVQYLSGTVTNSETNLGLDQAVVSLFQNDILVEKQTVGQGSNYKFKIDCDKTYKLVAEKENFKIAKLAINTNEINNLDNVSTLKLTPIECVQYLSGTVTNSETNLGLDQAVVSLFQNDILLEKQTVDKGSNYKFKIDCDKTYKLVAEKENYDMVELSITSNGNYNFEHTKTLKLTPIECVQYLSGTVTDSETNLPLPNAIVNIYRGKDLFERIKLDFNAAFNYIMKCDTPYRITVSHKNYHDLTAPVKSSDRLNEPIDLKLGMESSIEFMAVRQQKMIKTKTIYFDLDQSTIRLDAAIELNKVIAILMKYPNLKIEIKSHTDSRASADYNMKLTNDRAKTVIAYIISNNIDKSRVSGRGYGETELLNNCAKGIKCSEAEHQLNRRTEFIITDE